MNTQDVNNMNDVRNLRVPQNQNNNKKAYTSIMDAYNTQSKIPLLDPRESMSGDGLEGVKAKNIPISALRAKPQYSSSSNSDDNGNNTGYGRRIDFAKEHDNNVSISNAYRKMCGESDESNQGEEYDEFKNIKKLGARKSGYLNGEVTEADIEYIEDVPDDTDGIMHYLETIIQNTKVNLEMMESLYAALS